MLSEIVIDNAAVIKHLELSFHSGFSAFTGETGAGKSVLASCLSFVSGGNADVDMIRNGADCMTVSAVFDNLDDRQLQFLSENEIDSEDSMISLERRLDLSGKNKYRINYKSVPKSVYRTCGSFLLSISGQRENTVLLNKKSHIDILDNYSDIDNLLADYKDVFEEYEKLKKRLRDISIDEKDIARKVDILRFEINEIEEAKLKIGEDDNLTEKKERIKNSEKIFNASTLISNSLFRGGETSSAYDLISKAKNALISIEEYFDEGESHIEHLDEILSYLEDLSALSEDLYDESELGNPDKELDKIEGRLDKIEKLKRKYGKDIASVLDYLSSAKNELSMLTDNEFLKEELEKKFAQAEKTATSSAMVLRSKRQESGSKLDAEVTDILRELDMARTVFKTVINDAPLSPRGCDDVEFYLSTNPGEPIKPLSTVSSGGELSRVMLSLKSISNEASSTGTVVFDEIDTGVSGKTAVKIGNLLKKSAISSQIICITHSAQVAAVADYHYKVEKHITEEDRAETDAILLNDELRIKETARIMGGEKITSKLLASAKELIDQTRNGEI